MAAARTPATGLSTLIAHAAGLRAHELFTLAHSDEQPPDPRPARPEKFAGRPGRDYTVIGKGGLVGVVRLPEHLAERLEARRREQPVQVVDRGIRYRSRYDIAGGVAWSVSFGSASKRVGLVEGRARQSTFVRPGTHARAATGAKRMTGSSQPRFRSAPTRATSIGWMREILT